MRFYFFTVDHGSPENAGYEHCLLALAEGLIELGHTVAGNINYWPINNSWIIKKTDESIEDFDAILISNEWIHRYKRLPDNYIKAQKPKKIYIDASDGWRTDAIIDNFWPSDLILRTHFIQTHHYHKKVKPWAFGLTNRLISVFNEVKPLHQRSQSILCNFRVGHPVRDYFINQFQKVVPENFYWDTTIDTTIPDDDLDYLYWKLTGKRHYPQYFERLKESQLSLAFGGYFTPTYSIAPISILGRIHYKTIQILKSTTHTLGQFDSWRFWESLVSGAITVHVNFNEYNCIFPIQPNPETDYLGFLEKYSKYYINKYINYLIDNSNGRKWALKYYSPKATAERFLEWVF